jgi:hypothetical protein
MAGVGAHREIYILLLCRENTATQKRSALPEDTYFYKFFIIVFLVLTPKDLYYMY